MIEATYTSRGGKELKQKDIEDICNLVKNGVYLNDIRKKYGIGSYRLNRILKICNIQCKTSNGCGNHIEIKKSNKSDELKKIINYLEEDSKNIHIEKYI